MDLPDRGQHMLSHGDPIDFGRTSPHFPPRKTHLSAWCCFCCVQLESSPVQLELGPANNIIYIAQRPANTIWLASILVVKASTSGDHIAIVDHHYPFKNQHFSLTRDPLKDL